MRRVVAVFAVLVGLAGGACSAGVNVEDKGDGVRIEGDVDQQPPK